MTPLSGWGRYPKLDCLLETVRDEAEARCAVLAGASLIARGNGRAYGDAALNPKRTVSLLRADRIRHFDPATGVICCEAGMMLADLLAFALPRGYFPPAIPGTKFVTVGGMIAADVHGKNHHHDGTFSRHVLSLLLLLADGSTRTCSADENADLYAATCGGMGLTGIVLEATFRLMPVETGYIRQETLLARNLDEALALNEASSAWRYSVAWIDCLAQGERLGRAIVYRGEHARQDEVAQVPREIVARRARKIPVDFPTAAMNRWTIRGFNALYYRRATVGTAIVDYDRYFFPLDALLEWNRIYGSAGFVQYQCVIPGEASAPALKLLLERISAAGSGSFLAVLKLLGPAGRGMLSFPREGSTLALDFPASSANFSLLTQLDDIVADHGGRLYLAKDARSGARMLAAGYPRLDAFRAVRRSVDPAGKFSSLLSQRLGL
jgi:FAD/FMN-containing dehydrogenase